MRSFENENLINTLWIGEIIKQKVKKDIVIIEENKYRNFKHLGFITA